MDSNLILLTVAEISIYNIREYYYRFFLSSAIGVRCITHAGTTSVLRAIEANMTSKCPY